MNENEDTKLTPDECRRFLQEQVCEVEMLQSMHADRVVLEEETLLDKVKCYIDGTSDDCPPQLDFIVHLHVIGEKPGSSFEVTVSFAYPYTYPSSPPSVYIRCDSFNRTSQRQANDALQDYMLTLQPDSLIAITLLEWINENISSFQSPVMKKDKENAKKQSVTKCDVFSRLWIHSHHIKSKIKRKDILHLAPDFDLTGFMMPGKPGVICVEGLSVDCDDFWAKVRGWTWQKIGIREREDINLPRNSKSINSFRKFSGFREMVFGGDSSRQAGFSWHMDMGVFSKFLDQHSSSHLFPILFGGLEGK